MRKIALEEHFLIPELQSYWEATVEDLAPQRRAGVLTELMDFDDRRLAAMDAAEIDLAVLSIAGPGVHEEADVATAVRLAQAANDALAAQVQRHPARYAGFAHLAMQDPVAAAHELVRCVTQLGFKGALINGHTHGHYLDEEAYFPFWERAEALAAPIYLHPADPEAQYGGWRGHKHITRAVWGWTVETAGHALRLVFGGTFERFPGAKLVLGHMGETLPYLLWRFDSRTQLYAGYSLSLPPSEFIRRNIAITTSGMCSLEPLQCALAAMGDDNVMFSVDFPFEDTPTAATWIDTVAIDESVREKVCSSNAKRLLRL